MRYRSFVYEKTRINVGIDTSLSYIYSRVLFDNIQLTEDCG